MKRWLLFLLLSLLVGILLYMQLSNKGHDLLKYFEGCELEAYQDSVGVWTIGYGHTKGVHEGMVITQEQAEQMLLDELKEYEGYVEDMVEVELTQEQFDALVVWGSTLGPTHFKNSTLLKRINEGNFEDVPYQMKRWNKAGGKVLLGLERRREAEAKMFQGLAWNE